LVPTVWQGNLRTESAGGGEARESRRRMEHALPPVAARTVTFRVGTIAVEKIVVTFEKFVVFGCVIFVPQMISGLQVRSWSGVATSLEVKYSK
jgi:hypothetical protein